MNVLTIPRSVLALEYKALRYPFQLLETKVVATRLSQDSGLRLGYERLLAALDGKAGALVADERLIERGRALSRRADVIEKAVELEAKAEQRKDAADQQLQSDTAQAQEQRAQAEQTRQREVQQAEQAKKRAQVQASRTATERAQAGRNTAADEAQKLIEAERRLAAAEQTRIDKETAVRTAAPAAQLSDARKDVEAAAGRQADADELARLSEQEKQSRQPSAGAVPGSTSAR